MSDAASRRPSLGIVFLTLFLDLVGFSILFPLVAAIMRHYAAEPDGLLGVWMQQVHAIAPGATAMQREALFGGVLMGLYALLQFLCAPFWGTLSDRIGRRPVLVLTILGNTLGYLLWVFADSFALLLLSRVVCGLAAGNISVATAAVADLTDAGNRARGMGFVGVAFGLGFILGPALGGAIHAGLPHLGGAVATGGWGLHPFSLAAGAAAILSLGNLLWVLLRFPETRGAARGRFDLRSGNPLRVLSRDHGTAVRQVIRANLVFTVLFAALEATLVFLAADRLGYAPGAMAGIFVVLGLTSALVQGGLVRRLAPRLGERRLALIGLATMLPAYAALGAVSWIASDALLFLGLILLGIGIGCTMPALAALASLAAGAARQGAALGSFRSAGALARAIGPFLGAIAYFAIDPSAPYLIGGVLLLLPMLLLARMPAPSSSGDA